MQDDIHIKFNTMYTCRIKSKVQMYKKKFKILKAHVH